MTRLHHVKKARKADPKNGIKKGDSYYWWQFRFGGIHKSKAQPKRSQLTQSDFLSQLYDIEDRISETETINQSFIDELVSELEQLRDECQDKLSNMPDHLQESSSSGQTLQERIDGLDSWISDLESVDAEIDKQSLRDEAEAETVEPERKDFETDEKFEEAHEEWENITEEAFQEKLQERIEDIRNDVENANPGLG